jgi:putative ABC transport system permease protein
MSFFRLADLARDFRHAFRSLRRNPGFALTATLTLGLGLGATTAIFSVFDAALLRPLPFPEASRLVTLHLLAREGQSPEPSLFPWSYPKYELFRNTAKSFEALAGYAGPTNLNLITQDGPERLAAEEVSGAYFQVLALQAAAGRLLQPGEDAVPGEPAVVVLGHALWQRRFGGEARIIGQEIRLHGRALTVIGVAPPGFRGLTGAADVFVPITLATFFDYSEILREAGNHWFSAVGRLKPGVSLAAAEADARLAGAVVDRQYHFPEQKAAWSATVRELGASRIDPGFRRSVLLLTGAVGLVLLIACVNLTSLLLVRSVARRKEVAVRLALGAARARVIGQVLTESLAIALAGWAVGLLVAKGAIPLLLHLGPGRGGSGVSSFFDPASVGVDARVTLFALALSLFAAVLVGLLPALQASQPAVAETLKASAFVGKGRFSGGRSVTQQLLVVSEVALALMLLVGAGLLLRSFAGLQGLDVGFEPANVLTLKYAAADDDLARRDSRGFKEAVIARLEALPGVRAASIALCPPLAERCSGSVVTQVDGQRFTMGSGSLPIGLHMVTPDHFRTLEIPIVRGRGFTPRDRAGSPRVVVLNETAARRLWPGQDPLGRRLAAASFFFAGGDSTAEVVGIARDVRYGSFEAEAEPDLYYPALQQSFGGTGMIFVRTRGDPLDLLETVRREIHAIDPNIPLFNLMTMEQRAGAALARPRFATTLLGAFAGIALLLAAIGLYGVMAFSVAQRTREIGLRMALGAEQARVLRGVLRQGLLLAGIGIGLGLVGALALQRVIAGMLYGVESSDPLTLAAVSLLMVLAAGLAALLPARRAARVDPMEALRAE